MAVRFIQSGELLALAEELAGVGDGPGKPRTIRLRRSISTAYYAVFHRLTQHAAQRLIGDGEWTTRHAAVARWVTHTDLVVLADAVNGRKAPALASALAPVDTRLADLAQNFVDLQSARHSADYDDFYPVSKAAVLTYVEAARRAVDAADALYAESEASYLRFLGLVIGGVKVAKSR